MKQLQSLTLAVKIPAIILSLCLIAGSVTGIFAYQRAGASLEAEAAEKLTAVLQSRSREVQEWYAGIESDLRTQAQNPSILAALSDFESAWAELPGDRAQYLQDRYIDQNPHPTGEKENLDRAPDGSTYSAVHARIHPYMRKLLRERGYYDIFLFDAAGDLLYTVYKERDYATNFINGPWAESGLGEVFRGARNASGDSITFIDFAPYGPSADAPASFISQPLRDENGTFVGVLAYQMPVGRLNAMMGSTEGLGETGQAFIAGEDALLRSAARFAGEDAILSQRISGADDLDASDGELDLSRVERWDGTEVIRAATKVDVGGTNWIVVAEQATSELFAPVAKLRNSLMMQMLIITALTGAIGIFYARMISRPLRFIADAMKRVAGGDYDQTIRPWKRNDEIGRIGGSFLSFRDDLKTVADARNELDAKAEEAMRQAAITDAVEQATACIEFDAQGNVIDANENFLRTMGYQRDDIVGQHHRTFVFPEDASTSDYTQFWDRLRKGEPFMSRFRRRTATGNEIFLQAQYCPLWDDDGQVKGVFKSAVDVTAEELARRTAEADVKKRREEGEAKQAAQVKVSEALAGALAKVAEGDLTSTISDPFPEEYEKLRRDFNTTVSRLNDTVCSLLEVTSTIKDGSGDISSAADDLSKRTEHQAATLEQTAAALTEVTSTVNTTAEGAQQANEAVSKTRESAEQSGEVVRNAVAAMGEIEQSSNQISQIIGVIDEIAFQTNLLALNAGVEAARAGDAGKGFAVVASEVRALAQRSSEAAKEIKTLISASQSQVQSGVGLVGKTGEVLEGIVQRVVEISGLVSKISSSTTEQATALREVNLAMNQMDQVTQQNAAMVEQTTAASHSLTSQAHELSRLTGQFKVNLRAPVKSAHAPAATSKPRASAPAPKAKPAPKAVPKKPSSAPKLEDASKKSAPAPAKKPAVLEQQNKLSQSLSKAPIAPKKVAAAGGAASAPNFADDDDWQEF